MLPPFSSEKELAKWLPTTRTSRFYVFAVTRSFFGPVKVNCKGWTLLSTYCTENKLDLQLFTKYGILLHRGSIYIRQADKDDCILVAADSEMFDACVDHGKKYLMNGIAGKEVQLDHVQYVNDHGTMVEVVWFDEEKSKWDFNVDYFDHGVTLDEPVTYKSDLEYYEEDYVIFGKYYDSDGECDNVVTPYILSNAQAVSNPIKGTMNWVNGRFAAEGANSKLSKGDYLECVKDSDVIGSFDVFAEDWVVDPSTTKSAFIYKGKEDNKDRVLFHIPKSINPENYLITYNTCEMFMVPLKGTAVLSVDPIAGRYLCPAACTSHFHQITHCDWSIDKEYLDGLADAYGWKDGYFVRVFVRTHKKQKVFVNDANYINMMYNLPDEKILEFLLGTAEEQTEEGKLLFWQASLLEDNAYARALLLDRCSSQPTYTVEHGSADDPKNQVVIDQCSKCGLKARCPRVTVDEQTGELTKAVTDEYCKYFNHRSIKEYVEILGYFHVLSLIAKRVTYFTPLVAGVDTYVVTAPLALSEPEFSATDFFPVVYHNGIRVDQSRISFTAGKFSNPKTVAIGHRTDDEKYGSNIIENVFATNLKIKIAHVYHLTTDYRFAEGTKYFKLVEGGTYVEAEAGVSYNVGDRIEDTPYPVGGNPSYDWYVEEYPVEVGDKIVVELFTNASSSSQMRKVEVPSTFPEEGVFLQMNTVDSWQVYDVTKINSDYVTPHGQTPEMINQYTLCRPEQLGTFDASTKKLQLNDTWAGHELLIVENIQVIETSKEINITEDSTDNPGRHFFDEEGIGFSLDSEIVFLNNKRLINGLDYTVDDTVVVDEETGETAKCTSDLIVQNMSYINEDEPSQSPVSKNTLSMIRTCATDLSSMHGFLVGNVITWPGQNPFWFDSLSTLTIDGLVCSNFKANLGELTISDVEHHRNGAPYEIKTLVPTVVMELLDCDEALEEDVRKIKEISGYFKTTDELPAMRTIIPHSHKIVSFYLNELIKFYIHGEYGFGNFGMPGQSGLVRNPETGRDEYKLITEENFADQTAFAWFAKLKPKDLIYKLTEEELDYVDVYPYFHRLRVGPKGSLSPREVYNRLAYMVSKLGVVDPIKHKDAPYVR